MKNGKMDLQCTNRKLFSCGLSNIATSKLYWDRERNGNRKPKSNSDRFSMMFSNSNLSNSHEIYVESNLMQTNCTKGLVVMNSILRLLAMFNVQWYLTGKHTSESHSHEIGHMQHSFYGVYRMPNARGDVMYDVWWIRIIIIYWMIKCIFVGFSSSVKWE